MVAAFAVTATNPVALFVVAKLPHGGERALVEAMFVSSAAGGAWGSGAEPIRRFEDAIWSKRGYTRCKGMCRPPQRRYG